MKITHIISFFLLFFPCLVKSQQIDNQSDSNSGIKFSSVRPKKKKDSITFTANDYKMISHLRDTTAIDTSLSIKKFYKNNVWKKDLFGKMPFSNMAQPYNTLIYDFTNADFLPSMGAEVKKQLYLTPEEISYYLLPTPITEISYKTGVEQGQMVDALFSTNLNKRTNIFIAYRGVRSLGNYQRILVSNGNFRAGFSFVSKNERYTIFAHYAGHDIESQENGGLATPDQFSSGEEQFKNRAVIDINLTDAQNLRESKRYFFQHDYAFLRQKDTLSSAKQLRLRHQFLYETEYYSFTQGTASSLFGNSFVSSNINDRMQLQKMINTLGAEVELPYLGKSFVFANHYFYNYYFRNAYYKAGILQPHQLKGNEMSLALQWAKKISGFSIDAQGEQTFVGSITGSSLKGKLAYTYDADTQVVAGVDVHSSLPNFNFLLYQSDYEIFNWDNASSFKKEHKQTLYGTLKTKWGELGVSASNISNYTFFKAGNFAPIQYDKNIQYLKIKFNNEFKFKKFGLENTIAYQNVIQDENILNVPQFVTRNSLYFASDIFKKAMFLQTGVSFNYFTRYYSNNYNPLLAEFEVQTAEKTGGFPMFDFFINAKVRTMRIYLSLENFSPLLLDNQLFNKKMYHYFSAPNQPYRDWIIRLGISWNLFS